MWKTIHSDHGTCKDQTIAVKSREGKKTLFKYSERATKY
jgi:hypothetical protein